MCEKDTLCCLRVTPRHTQLQRQLFLPAQTRLPVKSVEIVLLCAYWFRVRKLRAVV
jgi:hypothetical protein